MTRGRLVTGTVTGAVALVVPVGIAVAQQGGKASSDDALIKSAMSAAPAAIAKDATIAQMTADGKMRTVRKGSNNFTCVPDDPDTPAPDPVCADDNSMGWMHAYMSKAQPPANKVGLMYMLAGAADASNTDPYAKKPAGGKWIMTGPHLMIVGAKGLLDKYAGGAAPDTSKPYVMWAGTPYEHLMVPVK
jgi:hypothetical protein